MLTSEQLNDYLDSQDNEFGLDYISTHGFLVAVCVGTPMPNWLDVLFDEQQDKVPSEVIEAVKAWHKEVLAEITEKETFALPMFADGDDDEMQLEVESELGDWSAGFIEAMYANENADWFEHSSEVESDEDEIATLTLPMVIFSGIEEEDEDLINMRNNEEIMAEMADSIVQNCIELFLIFNTIKG